MNFLTTRAAASAVGMHPETIREAIRNRDLKARRNGDRGRLRISADELQRWFLRTHKPA